MQLGIVLAANPKRAIPGSGTAYSSLSVDRRLYGAVRLRRSILERAPAGRLATQDPTDAPASVLLRRIEVEGRKLTDVIRVRRRHVGTVGS